MLTAIYAFLQKLAVGIAPSVQLSPVAAASAITALQGQFSTVDDSTALVARSTTTTTVSAVLRKTVAAGSALDTTSPLTILIDAGSGNTVTAPTTTATGTLVSVTGGGARWAQIVVMPNASGVVVIAITTSASASSVQLRHRTFATTFTATP